MLSAATAMRPLDRGETLHQTARALVQLIERLRRQHRAEITPTFGQLENLFDLSALLERQLEGPVMTLDGPVPPPCRAVEGCTDRGEFELVPGHFYCSAHARQVRRVLGQLPLTSDQVRMEVSA